MCCRRHWALPKALQVTRFSAYFASPGNPLTNVSETVESKGRESTGKEGARHRDAKKGKTVIIATEPKLHFSLRNSWEVKRLKGLMGELLIRHQRSESRP